MKWPTLYSGTLVRRYKRFLADIRLPNGNILTVHCPNTGSMRACAEPGWKAWYSLSDNKTRKYPGTWELVRNGQGHYIGINTQRANRLVEEGLVLGRIKELKGYGRIRAEQYYGSRKSRIDFLLEDHPRRKGPCYVEVKSVTLLAEPDSPNKGIGLFPDAVSVRARRHLEELIAVKEKGARAVLLYCVQHTGIKEVRAARDIDPAYAKWLQHAKSAGVEIMAFSTRITTRESLLADRLVVRTGRRS